MLREGEIGAGDNIEIMARDHARLSVHDIHIVHFRESDAVDVEGLRRSISIDALSTEWRGELEEILAQHG